MDSDDEFDLAEIRAKNVAQIRDMFGDTFAAAEKIANEVKADLDALTFKQQKVKRKKDSDSLFRFTGLVIPTVRRTSQRLSKTNPKYSFEDLDKVVGVDDDDPKDKDYWVNDLEDIIREPRNKRKSYSSRSTAPPVVRMPNEYTEVELNNIATKSGSKTYSEKGTCCHQCRQKTTDTKTVCRSGRCIGVRGQFCGPCLKNRYGEDARGALMNSSWACPPCRKLCNCSICRNRDGKRPTGILAPTVQREGFTSVKEFLLNLAEQDILSKRKKIKKNYNENDPIDKECNVDIINNLIQSYKGKIMEKVTSYEIPIDTIDLELVGFASKQPVFAQNEIFEGDVAGFITGGTSCLITYNNVLYQSILDCYR